MLNHTLNKGLFFLGILAASASYGDQTLEDAPNPLRIGFSSTQFSTQEDQDDFHPIITFEGAVTSREIPLRITHTWLTADSNDISLPDVIDVIVPAGDYTKKTGFITLPSLAVQPDTLIEEDEQLTFTLTSEDALANITQGETTFIIRNDDNVIVSVNVEDIVEGQIADINSPRIVTVTATLSEPSPIHDVVINYATLNNTAIAGSDFIDTNGTLTFPANDTTLSQQFTVNVLADQDIEPDEYFSVAIEENLNNQADITLPPPHTITIENDDVAGIQIVATQASSSETGESAQITLSLDTTASSDVVVALQTSDDTEGWVQSPVTIPALTRTLSLPVNGVDDGVDDDDIAYNIHITQISSLDTHYQALAPDSVAPVQLTNLDDDTPSSVALDKVIASAGPLAYVDATTITVDELNIIDGVEGALAQHLSFYHAIIKHLEPTQVNTAEKVQSFIHAAHRIAHQVTDTAPFTTPVNESDLNTLGIPLQALPLVNKERILALFNHNLALANDNNSDTNTPVSLIYRLEGVRRLLNQAQDKTSTPLDTDYLQLGVIPASIHTNTALLPAFISTLNDIVYYSADDASEADAPEKLAAFADALAPLFLFLSAPENPGPTVDNFKQLQLTGAHADNIFAIERLFIKEKIPATNITSKDAIQAIINHVVQGQNTINNYASSNGTTIPPLALVYYHLDIQGVSNRNIATLNAVIEHLGVSEVATPRKIQDIANASFVLLNHVSGQTGTKPTLDDMKTVGLTQLKPSGNISASQLLSTLNNYSYGTALDVPLGVQQLILDVQNVLDHADGGANQLPSANAFSFLGINGVNRENIHAVNLGIERSANTGNDVETREKLQAIVDGVNAAFDRVRDFANQKNTTPPSADVYSRLGIHTIRYKSLLAQYLPSIGGNRIYSLDTLKEAIAALERLGDVASQRAHVVLTKNDFDTLNTYGVSVSNAETMTRKLKGVGIGNVNSAEKLQSRILKALEISNDDAQAFTNTSGFTPTPVVPEELQEAIPSFTQDTETLSLNDLEEVDEALPEQIHNLYGEESDTPDSLDFDPDAFELNSPLTE